MPRKTTVFVALVLALAACGDDDAAPTTTTESPGTTAATTTTIAATSTTVVAETTTTLPPTTTSTAPLYQVDPTNFFPEVFGASGDPHGSGCVVGADVLPAGVWFGFVSAVGVDRVMTFDLACFFTGAAAVAAATADGEVGFDLDFYIRNQNPKTYSVPISPTAQVWYVDGVTIENTAILTGNWPTASSFLLCPGEFCSVWLYVNGGVATGIVEQYLP